MATHDFNNQSSQSERQRVKRDTYLTRAQSDADLTSQGRFKRETATRATGTPTYPSLPASSPWHSDPVPATEPLGFSVEAIEPNGTHAEIEASIAALKPPEVHALPAAVEDHAAEPVGTTPLVPTGSSIKRRRSW
jgi:hypothetical protein